MAGSQLKKLRSELKSKGLIGQTNTKSRNKKNKTPSDTRVTDKQELLAGIRNKFNVFDSRVNKVKRDVTTIQGGKFVKMGDGDASNPTKLNSFLHNQLKSAYSLNKARRGKNGKIIDRRFGENDKGLSQEEKMLQRFVRERESQSKSNKFSLESDDEEVDDEPDFTLTHSGKLLEEDEDTIDTMDIDQPEDDQPARKKTKAEVMKEVIAKSKFYKAERQKLFNKTQNEIENLDENFQDIFTEIGKTQAAANAFNSKTEKDIEYDEKVRGLVYDKRSVPADKTKTDEEIQKEYNDKIKKLEDDRLKRMEGERDAEGDDLDDFWENDSEGENKEEEDSEVEEKSGELDFTFPTDLEDFTKSLTQSNPLEYINKIIKLYKPNLREGNKERMNKFVSILFKYCINNPDDEIIKVLKKLSESYNKELVDVIRDELMDDIQTRIDTRSIIKLDAIYFLLCGYIFSSSDKYHLIIIPNLIMMNQLLSSLIPQDGSDCEPNQIGQSLLIIDIIFQYQRLSKRFDPEVNNCFIKILKALKTLKIDKTKKKAPLSITELFEGTTNFHQLVDKTYDLIDKHVSLFREYTVIKDLIQVLTSELLYYKNEAIGDAKKLNNLIDKLNKLASNIEKVPLTLQTHRKLAIKTLQPKFEDNFNPNKHYDLDLDKQEINKMKAQLKKERKETLKDIRRQNQFEGNEKLAEKVKMYDEYHKKMADIVNSISTIEGKERNDYEKEKRRNKEK